MKAIVIHIIILLSFAPKLAAQGNLIPNSSFEDSTQCPYNPGQIYFASPWTDPTNASSDYFNVCNSNDFRVPNNLIGYQMARTGYAYAGFATYYGGADLREYIQVALDSQLQANKNYYTEFYVSLADTQTIAANNMGAYFSNISLTGAPGQVLNFTPQINNDPGANPLKDKTSWTKVSGSFIANGTENYITIGNFLNDVSTDTVYVGGGCSGCDAAYYYLDDVSVICTDCDTTLGIEEMSNAFYCKLYPNPNDGSMNFIYSLNNSSVGEIMIYDVTGRVITKYRLQIGKNNQLFISEEQLRSGIYFYKVIIDNELKLSDKIVIIK